MVSRININAGMGGSSIPYRRSAPLDFSPIANLPGQIQQQKAQAQRAALLEEQNQRARAEGQRAEQFRGAVQALGPNANIGDFRAAAMASGNTGAALSLLAQEASLKQQQAAKTQAQANADRDYALNVAKYKNPTRTPDAKFALYQRAVDNGYQKSELEFRKELAGKNDSITFTTAGGDTFRMGAEPDAGVKATMKLEKPVRKKLQESLATSQEQMSRLNKIKKAYKPEYFTYAGQGAAGLGNVASKLQGVPGAGYVKDAAKKLGGTKEFIQGRRKLFEMVNQGFNAYRKEITGAAAAIQELEQLKEATLNTDLSPAEFEASLQRFEDEMMTGMKIKRQLLREGIDVSDPRFGPRFDELRTATRGNLSTEPAAGTGKIENRVPQGVTRSGMQWGVVQ